MRTHHLLLLLFSILAVLPSNARGKYDNTDTLFVSHDTTAEFHTVCEAIEVCRAFMEYKKVIFIKKGIYKEKVIIPSWLTNIELIGEDRDSTIITYNDHANILMVESRESRVESQESRVESRGSRVEGKIGTFRTYTMKIEGCNITLRNLTIENNAPMKGQAVALHTEGNRLLFLNCRFLGNQDTVYTGAAETMLYFKNCYIEGTTDFIFGPSTAWFEKCTINSKVNSFITAASTPKNVAYGYVFSHCHLTANDGVTEVYLGRPWRAYAHTLFMNCEMDSHIKAEGWQNWPDYHDPAAEGTVRYEEYNNSGPGAQPQQRVRWSRQLTKEEASAITPASVFGGDTEWILTPNT